MLYADANQYRTLSAPLTRRELEHSDYDTVFLVMELSDAIRRGVHYYTLQGDPLTSLNEVLNALVCDGEISYDDDHASEPISH